MDKPWVIVVTGPPGAGKSTTATELARLLGAALLDQDSMTNHLVDVVAGQLGVADYADPRLAALVREPRYESLFAVAADCLAAGVPVVLVAPFTAERREPAAWDALAQRIDSSGGRARLVWLRIDSDDLVARLRGRAAVRDGAKLADPVAWVNTLDLGAPASPALEVDALSPPKVQAREIVRVLGPH